MAGEDGFFSRWSRRKVEAREVAEAPAAPPAPAELPPVQAAELAAEPSAEVPAAEPPPTLEDTQDLTPASDFTRFVAADVTPEVKSAALKKLFADPQFNLMDGLDIYIDDYSQPDPIPPEILAKYAPRPLPPALARRLQTLFDVRAPGAGMLTPDGRALFFTWTITGVRQVFRVDGAMRFPTQLTAGEDPTSIVEVTPDGRWLILSRDRKGEEYPGLYLQDVKGGPLVEIQHKPKVQTIPQFITDDSRYLYFRANEIKQTSYAIYRYDLQAKKRELIFDQEGIWRLTDVAKDGRLLLGRDVRDDAVDAARGEGERGVLADPAACAGDEGNGG